MKSHIHFKKITDPGILTSLIMEWRKSLTAPQDGMWEAFTDRSTHWEVTIKGQSIGYACVDSNKTLLQFFVRPFWMKDGVTVFQQFLHQEKVLQGMVGTNNPIFLSLAMHFQKAVEVNTLLFADFFKVPLIEKEGMISLAEKKDQKRLVDFCHMSVGAPKAWLTGYLGNLIEYQELFILEQKRDVLGTFEVRKSKSDPTVADLGMIVSPRHRQKGTGHLSIGKSQGSSVEKKP